jgi:hypothetical protein
MSSWAVSATIGLLAFWLGQRVQQNKKGTNSSNSEQAVQNASAATSAASARITPAVKAANSRTQHAASKLKMVLVVRNDLGMGQ